MRNTPGSITRLSRLASGGASFLLIAALLAAPGCGGGGGATPAGLPGSGSGGSGIPTAGRGQVRFTIRWPEKPVTRLIPQAAQSIRFRCLDADDEDEVISEKVVTKGQTVVTLDLPSVRVKIAAEACAHADGSGQVLAAGSIVVPVKESQVTAARLTLDSVIREVRLTPAAADLDAGETQEVEAQAFDANGDLVLTDPASWVWTPEDGAGSVVDYATSGPRLTVTGRADGSGAFVATETESGKTARLTVTSHAASGPGPVLGQPGLVVEPSSINLTAGQIITPRAYWRDAAGQLTPIHATFWSFSDVFQFYHNSNGPNPMVAMKQGETFIPVEANNQTVQVPIKVSGYILSAHVLPGENGEAREIAVYIDGNEVLRVSKQGNELGKYIAGSSYNALAVPIELTPGQHRIAVKDVTGSSTYYPYVTAVAKIVNVGGFSGSIAKDGYDSELIIVR